MKTKKTEAPRFPMALTCRQVKALYNLWRVATGKRTGEWWRTLRQDELHSTRVLVKRAYAKMRRDKMYVGGIYEARITRSGIDRLEAPARLIIED